MDKETLKELKDIDKTIRKEDKSLKNRLQSILFDNKFLTTEVCPVFPYPVIPNERCGLWYVDPSSYQTTSYFKSTDGHINQWDFSTRRLNIHLLPILGEEGGVVIVDSTRRGKKIPDALSKTIPIWCAVLNYMILEAHGEQWPFANHHILFTPPNTVPASEHDRILAKIPDLVMKLKKLDILPAQSLCKTLNVSSSNFKLLRPIWVYPGSSLLELNHDIFSGKEKSERKWEPPADITPIILCTISYQCQDGTDKRHGFTYVQGAADDHELWADRLTPGIFWQNVDKLRCMDKTDKEVHEICANLTSVTEFSDANFACDNIASLIKTDNLTDHLCLGTIMPSFSITHETIDLLRENYSLVILCDGKLPSCSESLPKFIKIFNLPSCSKKSSRDLRSHLITINSMLKSYFLNPSFNTQKPVLIACDTGKDISVSIMLVALCLYYNLQWEVEAQDSVNKTIIKKHLAKIIDALHGRNVNPSRASLNSVNSFLM